MKLGENVAVLELSTLTQGETQMQTQKAYGWSLTIFINTIGEVKSMVVDRQKVKTSSESKRYQRAGRIKVSAGRMIRQVGK